MENECYQKYKISISYLPEYNNYSYYKNTSSANQKNYDQQALEIRNKNLNLFYSILNKVVELGGIIDLEKYELDNLGQWTMHEVAIKIKPSQLDQLRTIQEISRITPVIPNF